MITLNSAVKNINRIGNTTAKRLLGLGVETVEELLFYFPFRYDNFGALKKISELKAGEMASIAGQIELIQNKRSPRRRMNITEALINDGSESIKAVWFNQPYLIKNLKTGDYVSLAGRVDEDYLGLSLVSPEYEKITDLRRLETDLHGQNPPSLLYQGGDLRSVHTSGLVPVYNLTAGLSSKQLRFLIKSVINLAAQVKDWLPEEVKKNQKLITLAEAIKKIHFPENQNDIDLAKKRLGFDELFLIQIQSQLIKKDLELARANIIEFKEEETKKFVESLPFKLTDAQKKAAWEIIKDMGKDRPMARLLEGDVGSGKTLVAVMAMLNVALNNRQAVLMVPTEILARQHYQSVCKLFSGLNIEIGLVTGSEKKFSAELGVLNDEFNNLKNTHHSEFITQNSKIIIGTHSLIQESVGFNDLSLAIIDEQHRFGVEQRKKLTEKITPLAPLVRGEVLSPHLLSMTATPIPRSLALALYGDLDISIINEMPKDRKKILTKIVSEDKREKAYEFIRKQIGEGRQAFVICPLIDQSDKLGVKSVKEEFEKLDKIIFPDIKIGILHGRMKAKEKEEIMQSFLNNEIKILVSTSVVEVGVDVSNATIMMIEGADRFGLASLHQFRGRVGRGAHQSYCFLFADSGSPKTAERMQAMVDYHDGFMLAKMDLKFRGPGEVYGTMQKGFPELKIASLFDYSLMKLAKEEAEKIIIKDFTLESWPLLRDKEKDLERQTHLE